MESQENKNPSFESENRSIKFAKNIGHAALSIGISYASLKFGEAIFPGDIPNYMELPIATAVGGAAHLSRVRSSKHQ